MLFNSVEKAVNNVEKHDSLQFVEVLVDYNDSTDFYEIYIHASGFDNFNVEYYNRYSTRIQANNAKNRLISKINDKYGVICITE